MEKGYIKLMRDKDTIQEVLASAGVSPEKSIAKDHEYIEGLFNKLNEENAKFHTHRNSKNLADIIQVINLIKKIPEFKGFNEFIEINKKINKNEPEVNHVYVEELFKKLNESIVSFSHIKKSEELSNVIEVIESIKALPEFGKLESIKYKNLKEKGGFKEKRILKF